MSKTTIDELENRISRLERIQELKAELLRLEVGPLIASGESGPASFRTEDAAKHLGVSVSTLWKLVAEERLPPPKGEPNTAIRLWPRRELEQYLKNLPRSTSRKNAG